MNTEQDVTPPSLTAQDRHILSDPDEIEFMEWLYTYVSARPDSHISTQMMEIARAAFQHCKSVYDVPAVTTPPSVVTPDPVLQGTVPDEQP